MTTRAELSAADGYGHGHTALMRAARDGNTEQVEELLRQGADINERDELMAAALAGDLRMVKALLNKRCGRTH